MSVRVFIIHTDYVDFLRWLYLQRPELREESFAVQLEARRATLFGTADFYTRNFIDLGWEATDVYANNDDMQRAWAGEHDTSLTIARAGDAAISLAARVRRVAARTPLRHLKKVASPVLDAFDRHEGWQYAVLAAQIEDFKPDVILNQAVEAISPQFLSQMRAHYRLLVGQIASPLPAESTLRCYDLLVSSLPNFVDYFRRLGVRSERSPLAFDPTVLTQLPPRTQSVDVSFVGSLWSHHQGRLTWLQTLGERCRVDTWGPVGPDVDATVISHHHGSESWGIEMYRILASSKLTLNYHIGLSEQYANNLRLFDATGVGAFLLTDWKENLQDFFDVGTEVVAFRTPAECADLIAYYLDHEAERSSIAKQGQQRTLRDHTYRQRIAALQRTFERYL